MWDGVESEDKDPRKSLHVGEIPTPEIAPDEVYLAVMASSINFNTVWTSIFEPLPTFGFLDRLGKESELGRAPRRRTSTSSAPTPRVSCCGSARRCATGSRATGSPSTATTSTTRTRRPTTTRCSPPTSASGASRPTTAAWPTCPIVKANQLMPKPAHLTWEEAAVNALCASTSYRMLVGQHAARMKQGDNVFVWGATGGIGAYAIQLVLNGGGTPVGVVSSEQPGRSCSRRWAASTSSTAGPRATSSGPTSTPRTSREWRRLGKKVRSLIGEDPDIVFEHPGRSTMGASVFITKRGGTIVTCAATSGYMIEYDNRHLWMKLKRIVS